MIKKENFESNEILPTEVEEEGLNDPSFVDDGENDEDLIGDEWNTGSPEGFNDDEPQLTRKQKAKRAFKRGAAAVAVVASLASIIDVGQKVQASTCPGECSTICSGACSNDCVSCSSNCSSNCTGKSNSGACSECSSNCSACSAACSNNCVACTGT